MPSVLSATMGCFREETINVSKNRSVQSSSDKLTSIKQARLTAIPSGTISSTGGGKGHTHTIEPSYLNVYVWKRTA